MDLEDPAKDSAGEPTGVVDVVEGTPVIASGSLG